MCLGSGHQNTAPLFCLGMLWETRIPNTNFLFHMGNQIGFVLGWGLGLGPFQQPVVLRTPADVVGLCPAARVPLGGGGPERAETPLSSV